MRFSYIISTLAFCLSINLLAQEQDLDTLYLKETDYIRSYLNRMTGRIFFVNTSNSFILKNRLGSEKLKLVPNKQDRIGASVSFRFLTLSYSFAPEFISENKDNKGSKLFFFNIRSYFGKWMQTLDVYRQKGFFIEYDSHNAYFPEISSLKIGGSTSYVFNDHFSFRAIVTQDEQQLKSAGSFIPRVNYYYTLQRLRAEGLDEKIHLYDIALSPSYFYNFVPTEDILLSLGASAGIGLNYSESRTESLTSLLTELQFRASFTYHISNLYIGSQYSYLILNHNTDKSTYVKDHIPHFQVSVGYRFKAPKKWIQMADSMEEKTGL